MSNQMITAVFTGGRLDDGKVREIPFFAPGDFVNVVEPDPPRTTCVNPEVFALVFHEHYHWTGRCDESENLIYEYKGCIYQ
jgi:hypothetical protein